jgi:type VI protein secretion system component Hcp
MNKLLVLSAIVLSSLPLMAQISSQAMTAKKAIANPVLDPSPAADRIKVNFPWKSGPMVSEAIISPRDAASGLPTGKRMHKPFVITKEIDRSSPLLLNALNSHEVLPSLEITYAGKPDNFCGATGRTKASSGLGGGKVSLQDITFRTIKKVSPNTEEITFDYGTMTVTGSSSDVVCQESSGVSAK